MGPGTAHCIMNCTMVTRNACFKADTKSTDVALIKKCRLPTSSVTTLQRFDYQNWSTH